MADSTTNLDTVSPSSNQQAVQVNALIDTLSWATKFGRRASTTSALTWGMYRGRINGTLYASVTVSLSASTTNYIVAHRTTLAVSTSTSATNWNDTVTYGRCYKVITGASTVSSFEDHRDGADGILGGTTGGGAPGASTLAIFPNLQTGTTYTVQDDDRGEVITFSNTSAIAVTLPQAGSLVGSPSESGFVNGWFAFFQNRNTGTVTITPTTSTVDGASSLTLRQHEGVLIASDGTNYYTSRGRASDVHIQIACSDEYTALTAGAAKAVFRMPHAMTVKEVRASLTTASSSGLVTVDINENGSTILSTKITIDAGEKTSTTAATPPVISDNALADDAEITIDIDGVGAGSILATGLKVTLIGSRTP